jgi:hypothetical protein
MPKHFLGLLCPCVWNQRAKRSHKQHCIDRALSCVCRATRDRACERSERAALRLEPRISRQDRREGLFAALSEKREYMYIYIIYLTQVRNVAATDQDRKRGLGQCRTGSSGKCHIHWAWFTPSGFFAMMLSSLLALPSCATRCNSPWPLHPPRCVEPAHLPAIPRVASLRRRSRC